MSVQEIAASISTYPLEAYAFVQQGLQYTVSRVHATNKIGEASRHVSGQQLCEGLREYAHFQWGMLASAVLARWNIRGTYDFGRIVFALIEGGVLQKTAEDDIEDFRNVYDFAVLESAYQVESKI